MFEKVELSEKNIYVFNKYIYIYIDEKNGFERNLWMKVCWKMKFVKVLLKKVF